MYITKIQLHNIRCFKKFELDFTQLGESAIIAADNGDGKTTLLRSIAMGLCDQSSAAALIRELPGKFVRKRAKKPGIIRIHLEDEKGSRYEIETIIQPVKALEMLTQDVWIYKNGKRQKSDQLSFPWENIFVCGYGAGRHTHGTWDFEEYVSVDAVYTLFRYHEPLQNPELALHRLVEKARRSAGEDPKKSHNRAEKKKKELLSMLKEVLNLDDNGEVILTPKAIMVKGHWGTCTLSSLGDGYKAMTTCVLDFLTWTMLFGKPLNRNKISGVVLIDEIEQHLHPRWQLKIMGLLQDAFRKIQFIVTTHSPLVVSGSKNCKVHTLFRGQHKVATNVYGSLAEDVYHEVMKLSSSAPSEVEYLVKEFQELYFKKLKKTISRLEKDKLREIETKLKGLGRKDPQRLMKKLDVMDKYLR